MTHGQAANVCIRDLAAEGQGDAPRALPAHFSPGRIHALEEPFEHATQGSSPLREARVRAAIQAVAADPRSRWCLQLASGQRSSLTSSGQQKVDPPSGRCEHRLADDQSRSRPELARVLRPRDPECWIQDNWLIAKVLIYTFWIASLVQRRV